MIRKTVSTPMTINLDGPTGNVYCIIGMTPNLLRTLQRHGVTKLEKINEKDLVQSMMDSKSYTDVLCIFEDHFGEFVILETKDESIIETLSNRKRNGEE